ncbi:unnamed protein product, partial [Allacma fusca]
FFFKIVIRKFHPQELFNSALMGTLAGGFPTVEDTGLNQSLHSTQASCHNHEPYQGKVYFKTNLTDGGEPRSQSTVSGQDDNSRKLQCLQCSFKTGRESTLRRHALKHAQSSETPINLENSTSLNKIRHIGGSKAHKKIPMD